MKQQFDDVSARHGAPMGRFSTLSNPAAIVEVFRVRMVDGDYDDGGAYWGGSEPLYCARDKDGEFEDFVRAANYRQACELFKQEYPELEIADEFDFEGMLDQYLATALWSSTDGDPPEHLDSEYDVDDIALEAVEKAREACCDFFELCAREGIDLRTHPLGPEQVGHDFWLTRNHHGAGFWDRGLGELGDKLTELAHSFGECNPYVGDDGKIYLE